MIYKRVLQLCDERKITVARLEKECSLGNATVRGWEHSSPRLETLMKVANYFGVPVEYFLKEE